MDKQRLVEEVIEQMRSDVERFNDWTAIEALLWNVKTKVLLQFLPEDHEYNRHTSNIDHM